MKSLLLVFDFRPEVGVGNWELSDTLPENELV